MTEATIFATALDKPDPAERTAYLETACAGDADLRRRVDELLDAHDRAGGYLEQPAVEQLTAIAGLDFLKPSEQPGSLGRFADYEVQEVLGRRPFGAVVLKAFDARLHRVVALKLLTSAAGGMAPQRFLREARAAAAVRDEHVVALHAVAEEPLPHLVMEYVDGQTLQQKLERSGPPELQGLLRIGVQVARGLAAIHAQGLVHRDLKPANILLENGIERVKITDFGLARVVDDAGMTQAGTIAGTPTYMSPEQARGEPVDQRSDLFSLGSVLYALCTGQPPFRAADTLAVLRRVIDDTPRPVRTLNADVPAWLSDLIARLNAKRLADRPQSAREVADLLAARLAALQTPGGVPAKPHSAGQRRWVAAAVALLALAGIGMAEGTGVTQLTGTVIRLFDPTGTLVIEADDPNVSIAIDGQEVVITGAGPRELRLRAGPHLIEPAEKGLRLDPQQVTIERNGKVVVRVHREPPAQALNKPPPPTPSDVISALEIVKTFQSNAARAAEQFTDRRVRVSGRMLRITGGDKVLVAMTRNVYARNFVLEMVGDPSQRTYLSFQFLVHEAEQEQWSKLKVDQLVTVEGLCKGWLPAAQQRDDRKWIYFWDSKVIEAGDAVAKHSATVAVGKTFPGMLVQWVQSVGGSLRIKYGSPAEPIESWVGPNDKLPSGWFGLTAVTLNGCKNVDDAKLSVLNDSTELTTLQLENVPITNAGLARIVRTHGLTDLNLTGTAVGDGAIPLLAKLPKLQLLYLARTKLTAAGLEHLDELGRMTILSLADLPLTDTGMASLGELTLLADLDLSGTRITEAGARALAKLDNLQYLKLARTKVTDASLETLGGLKRLTGLNLDGTQVTGKGLDRLAGLDKLQVLSLANTPLTDAGLDRLAALKGLRSLDVRGTQLSASAVARLRRALSECQVNRE